MVLHAAVLRKRKSNGISGRVFGPNSSFFSNKCLPVVLDGKSLQEYPVCVGVPHCFIPCPSLSLLYINDLTDDVICNIAIYADDSTLCSKCD